MKFTPEFLDDIRARVPVSQVVGQKIKLKRTGREWVGLSPWGKEKTPSFYCADHKSAWFDFSAGKTGDIFSFLMETEGLSFPEAVEKLAGFAGLEVPANDPNWEHREAKRLSLIEVMESAHEVYREVLTSERLGEGMARESRSALGYLNSRGVGADAIAKFGIGYAPADRSFLKQRLSASCGADALAEAGLLIHGEDIPVSYDRFRARIIFPIRDLKGRVVGFGGRMLDDAKPKYLNSPETPIFHKGSILYNQDQARQPAHDGAPLLMVEGYTATIAAVGAGFPATVATLGTALTDDHLLTAWRMSPSPILCFDGDLAGKRAAAKVVKAAFPHLLPGRTLQFAMMPPGQDPDDMIRKQGASAFKRAVDGAIGLFDMFWRGITVGRSLTTPDALATVESEAGDLIETIPSEQLRSKYFHEMRDRLRSIPRRTKLMRSNGHSYHSTSPGALRLVHGKPTRSGMTLKEASLLAMIAAAPMTAGDMAEEIASDNTLSGTVKNAATTMICAFAAMSAFEPGLVLAEIQAAGLGTIMEEVYSTVHRVGITAFD